MPATPEPVAVAGNDVANPDLGLFTVPNLITLVRMLVLPLFLWFLFARDNRAAAAWTLAVLGSTDWVDGYVARRFNQVSEIGKIIDPVADRLLLFVGIVAIMVDGSVPTWVGILVLVREIGISIAVLGLAAMGGARVDVTFVGKTGTAGNLMAFPLFLGSESTLSYAPVLRVMAWMAVIPGLIFSYYAAMTYIPLARDAFTRGRGGRTESE
jgi:cardiolipin synthase